MQGLGAQLFDCHAALRRHLLFFVLSGIGLDLSNHRIELFVITITHIHPSPVWQGAAAGFMLWDSPVMTAASWFAVVASAGRVLEHPAGALKVLFREPVNFFVGRSDGESWCRRAIY